MRLPADHQWQEGEIFVFGSNLRGAHGAGAALDAVVDHGAVGGVGEGLTGRAYAIPTKDERIAVRSLEEIAESVERFKAFARLAKATKFFLTRVGCGLAGYRDEDIAPMFADAPPNVRKPEGW